MSKSLLLILLCISLKSYSQKILFGKIVTEQDTEISGVLVVNIDTDEKAYTNTEGYFKILAEEGDELRFSKERYDRGSTHVFSIDFHKIPKIILIKNPIEIEKVKIKPKLTGNINKDSKSLNKKNPKQELQNIIDLPPLLGKPREKPAEVVKDILFPIVTGQLNLQAIYDVTSGKAKKQKRLYRYEDLQDNINWVRERLEDDYFINLGIPKEEINNFLIYSFAQNSLALGYVKAKKISGFVLQIEKQSVNFVKKAINKN